MRKLRIILLTVGCVAALSLAAGNVSAQPGGGGGGGGRGNFDPAQFRQMQLDRLKTTLDVTDDGEWKVLEAAIGKVIDAQAATRANAVRGGGRRGGQGGGGQGGAGAGAGGGRGGFGGTPSPEAEALQKAIEDKAPAEEIKAKLAKLREVSTAAEANLTKAQDDLKKLLTSRQEAIAVLNGLLK
jgi:hypothetical protein